MNKKTILLLGIDVYILYLVQLLAKESIIQNRKINYLGGVINENKKS